MGPCRLWYWIYIHVYVVGLGLCVSECGGARGPGRVVMGPGSWMCRIICIGALRVGEAARPEFGRVRVLYAGRPCGLL